MDKIIVRWICTVFNMKNITANITYLCPMTCPSWSFTTQKYD